MPFADRLIAYVEEAGFPEFRSEIKGASPDRISALESHTGPLPDSYREYLAAMGERCGFLSYCDEGEATISDVLSLYEDFKQWGDLPPREFILISNCFEYQLALDCRKSAEPPVVRWEAEPKEVYADSLEQLCFSTAFWACYMQRLRKRIHETVGGPNDFIDRGALFLKSGGFTRERFSSASRLYGRRADAAIAISRLEAPSRFRLSIGAPSEEEATGLLSELLVSCGAARA